MTQFIQIHNASDEGLSAHLIVDLTLLLVLFQIIERLCQWQIGAVHLKEGNVELELLIQFCTGGNSITVSELYLGQAVIGFLSYAFTPICLIVFRKHKVYAWLNPIKAFCPKRNETEASRIVGQTFSKHHFRSCTHFRHLDGILVFPFRSD